jgi:hypothetical protein
VQGTSLQDGSGSNLQTMHLTWAHPMKGRWTLDLTQINGIQSMLTSVPVSGTISFAKPDVSASGLPDSSHDVLPAGVPQTATIHVVNTGNSPEFYSVDPRLNQETVLSLNSLTPTTGTLPISSFPFPQFVVPPFSDEINIVASTSVPVNFDTSPNFGFPDILSTTSNNALATESAPDIAASVYSCTPTEIGPGNAVVAPFSCGATADTQAFDPAVTSSTGNLWSDAEGLSSSYAPLELLPGQSADITVTITPNGAKGTVVSGFLAVETFNQNTFSSDQLSRIPYKYSIG